MPTSTIILLVEDDPGVREALSELLRLVGYIVLTAATVEEAEAIRDRLGLEIIDLVIAEIHVPAGLEIQEGYGLYQRWTALRPALPFILISGDPHSRDLPAIRSGAVRFLVKPPPPEALLAAIRATVGE